ncbi:hypothetical protein MKX08_010465 [Trichoderma sp. CBMAI-0020]|nr:hypothetical protein MKX08_010465 [Trichoderma sp. CBMAI-0020]
MGRGERNRGGEANASERMDKDREEAMELTIIPLSSSEDRSARQLSSVQLPGLASSSWAPRNRSPCCSAGSEGTAGGRGPLQSSPAWVKGWTVLRNSLFGVSILSLYAGEGGRLIPQQVSSRCRRQPAATDEAISALACPGGQNHRGAPIAGLEVKRNSFWRCYDIDISCFLAAGGRGRWYWPSLRRDVDMAGSQYGAVAWMKLEPGNDWFLS